MYGLWCLIFLIIIAGAVGGFIYTLSSSDSHSFKIPFRDREYDSGFLGHVIIGIGGGFVAIAAAILALSLDLNVFDQIWNSDNPPRKLLPSIIYTLAIGIIGGYSGLRIISGLSDAMIKKLEHDIDALKSRTESNSKEYESKMKVLEMQLSENYQEDKRRETILQDTLDRNLMLEGLFLIKDNHPIDGSVKLSEYVQRNPKNAKGWSWLAMGQKRSNKIDDAISSAKKAIELSPDSWVYHYNLACYLSLKMSDIKNKLELESNILDCVNKSLKITEKDHSDREELINLLNSDQDLTAMRSVDKFTNLLNSVN